VGPERLPGTAAPIQAMARLWKIELQPLSSINQVFDRLQHGGVASCVVLDFVNGIDRLEQVDVASGAVLELA
jgi:hypothetical protein